jgi:hypothetical protein
MKKLFELNSKNNRDLHNKELIERMKSGETLQRYTAQSSWFPPRPMIKKDLKAIETLYREKKDPLDQSAANPEKK